MGSARRRFPFVDNSVDNVLLQTNPDFTNKLLLNSSVLQNVKFI